MAIFTEDRDREVLLHLVESEVRAGTLIVHAFCFMSNHIHLLCETPVAGLSRWMQKILGRYADKYNRIHERVGHLWQGRYKAIVVQDGTSLIECSRYIHLNPYRAGLEQETGTYPWSSYLNFVNGEGRVPWVCTERVLCHFEDRQDYHSYVESGKCMKLVDPFKLANAGVVLGNGEFISRIREFVRRRALSPESPSQKTLCRSETCPSVQAIRAVVDSVFGGWSPCQKRRALVWALYANTWMSGRQIAQVVSLSPKAVGNAAKEMEGRRGKDPVLALQFKALQAKFNMAEQGHIARIIRSFEGSDVSNKRD
jgi:putative transposase